MPNPNTYECKACGASFDSKEKLDDHNRRQHSSGATSGTAGTGASAGGRESESNYGTGGTSGTGQSGQGGSSRDRGVGAGTGGSGQGGQGQGGNPQKKGM